VVGIDDTTRLNVSHSELQGASASGLLWAPNGRRLAFTSNVGGEGVHLYVWDSYTKDVRMVQSHSVDVAVRFFTADGPLQSNFLWRDDSTIVCFTLPPALSGWHFDEILRAQLAAIDGWTRAARGVEPSASVLDVDADTTKVADAEQSIELSIANVSSGETRQIGHVAADLEFGHVTVVVSPDKKNWAVLSTAPRRERIGSLPDPGEQLVLGFGTVDLGRTNDLSVRPMPTEWRNVALDTRLVERWRWSTRGSLLFTVQQHAGDVAGAAEGAAVAAIVSPDGAIRVLDSPCRCSPTDLQWLDSDTPAVLLSPLEVKGSPTRGRDAWWSITPAAGQTFQKVYPDSIAGRLEVTDGSGITYGISQHRLWMADSLRHRMSIARSSDALRVEDCSPLTVPSDETLERGSLSVLCQPYISGTDTLLLAVMALHGRVVRVDSIVVRSGFDIVGYSTKRRQALARRESGGQSSLRIINTVSGETIRSILELNGYLDSVQAPTFKAIRYAGVDGDSLTALLVLPINYRTGMRYPLVTWVYAGRTYSAADTNLYVFELLNQDYNLNLLTAAGYAVLLPSMPLPADASQASASYYIDLPKGVLPAIDSAIAIGIADPNRLAVMGHSFGGFTTYALITETARFRAAIAISGLTDLQSNYGTFSGIRRYSASDNLGTLFLLEKVHPLMGGPPWQRFWKYAASSPINYVDRVTTPLLIIHGDLDDVPISQAEEFYRALVRQHKRVRFARYWGEGHVMRSPANFRDMWHEILGWLATHLNANSDNSPGNRSTSGP